MRTLQRKFDNINDAMAQIVIELITDGESIEVINAIGDKVTTLDLADYTIAFAPGYANIITLPERKFSLKCAQAEFLWYMSGNTQASVIAKYLKNWEKFANDNGCVNSNYGYRWNLYIPTVIEMLGEDKFSRRAVVNQYCSTRAPFGKDTPCTLTTQFLIRNNQLCMIVTMRSNDIWYGFSIDQFCNGLLHKLVYHSLLEYYPNLEIGWYSHHTGSMHCYTSTSKGNACITADKLAKLFTENQDGLGNEIFEIGREVTFTNFWETAKSYFDAEMFEYFNSNRIF